MSPAGRLRRLVAAALVDSFGLSLGWTVFSLQVVRTHGLAALGMCGAAMLVGVALSAPATARLSAWMDGRVLLRATAAAEAVLRVATFTLLLVGAPLWGVAVVVVATNVVAWTGYAGMRAEVAAADPRGAAMTWYMVAVAAIEAGGIATAALLPTGPGGAVHGGLLLGVVVFYGVCLLPTWYVAGDARVGRQRRRRVAAQRRPIALLAGGALVMLLGSGPTLLAVGLAAELHGTRWVAGSALAFALGSLLAPLLVARCERRALPPAITWPAWGVGMVAGWVMAPWHPAGLLAAQLLAGMCMSALEGDMDARMAAIGTDRGVTSGLASAAALRAFGSAAAVGLVPRVTAGMGVGWVSAALAAMLDATLILTLAWDLRHAKERARYGGGAPAARIRVVTAAARPTLAGRG
jgi:hypothetical protein